MDWTQDGAGGLDLWGISPALIARLTGLHIDTARRYKRAGKMPAHLAALLRLRLEGELGELDPAWAGWRLVGGELVSPEGVSVRPGDVRAIPYRAAQLAELQRRALEPRQWELFAELPAALVGELVTGKAG